MSVIALLALTPAAAMAIVIPTGVDVGAAGKALTTGSIVSNTGSVSDGGVNLGVTVLSGAADTVTVTDATINNLAPATIGLYVTSSSNLSGVLAVNMAGANDIRGTNAGVQVTSAAESIVLDTSAGGGLYSGGVLAISSGGDVTIQNGANTILGANSGLYGATTGAGRTVVINSTGGTIDTTISGIVARGDGGGTNVNLVIGQGAGITSAITTATGQSTGILAVTTGLGAIDVRTGAGGTINGGFNGISASTSGAGAVSINAGGAIGQTTAPSGTGVAARSTGGSVVVNATAPIRSAGDAIYAATTGAGTVTINAGAVTSTSSRGIRVDAVSGAVTIAANGAVDGAVRGIAVASTGGGAITIHAASTVQGGSSNGIYGVSSGVGSGAVTIGSANQRLGGAVTGGGGTGLFAQGLGDVSVYAGAVTGATNGLVAQNTFVGTNGAVTADATGPVVALNGSGVFGANWGNLTTNSVTIRAADVTSTGGSAIVASTGGGDINITTTGTLMANPGNGQFWTAIYAESEANGNIAITTGGTVTGTWNGIDAIASPATTRGAITINTAAAVSGQRGIRAVSTGTGGVTIASQGLVTGSNGAGVFASSAGNVSVATGAVTSTGGVAATLVNNVATGVTSETGYGVAALSSGGSVTVNATGQVTGGAAGGVLAQVTGGAGAVSVTTNAVMAGVGRGIEVDALGGPITVTTNGAVSGQTQGINIITAGAGTVTVHTGSTVQGGTSSGIYAKNTGSGAVSFGTSGQRLDGAVTAGGTGLFAASAGSVSVYAGSVTGGTRGIVAASQYDNASGAVLVDVTGPVIGQSGYGILGIANGSLATDSVTIRAVDITSTGGSAISANTVNGDINVATTGILLANPGNGQFWTAIYAETESNGNIAITTGGTVTGSWNGIDAIAGAATDRGAITINTAAAVSGQRGIRAVSTGTGGVAIASQGLVTGSNGAGVFASSAGNVSIATGAVTSTGGAAVTLVNDKATDVTSDAGYGVAALSSDGSVTVNATGLVTGGAAGGVLAQVTGGGDISVSTAGVSAMTGRAIEIDADGGAVTLNTTGAIYGAARGVNIHNAGPGAITIHTAGTVQGGTSLGIQADNTGSGAVSVGTADQRLGGAVTAATTGIFAAGAGDVSVYAGAVNAGGRGIVAAGQYDGANGAVVVDVNGPLVALTSYGIIGVNDGTQASNTLSIRAQDVTSTGGSAISAQTAGGDITVVTTGAITANTGDNGTWDGIYADGRGDSLISVTTNGAVTGSYRGIDANSLGTTARSGIRVTTSGSVSGGQGQAAIIARLSGLGDIAVNAGAGLLSSVNGTGISANASATTGVNNITVNNLAAIGGAGAARVNTGVSAHLSAGNAGSINVTSTGAIQAVNTGIVAATLGSGSVTITAGGVITTPGVGISGSTTSGALTITTLAGGQIAPGALVGISAHTVDGAIVINQAGNIGAVGAGNTVGVGINAFIESGSADLIINSTGGIYVTPGVGLQSAGIYAVHGGTGAVRVTSSGVIDPGAYGVVVQGAGDVSYAATGGVIEGDVGVYIASTGNGNVSLTSTSNTVITGFNGAGITAVGGTGVTSLVVNGAVSGATTGIEASSTGTGSTVVTTNGPVSGASTAGIVIASGTGGLQLTVNANVTSTSGAAINATSTGGGVINIAPNTVVSGLITNPNTAVINLATASGTTSTINVGAGAVVQSAAGSAYDVAVRATGGSVVINNQGVLTGTVDFSALTGANTGQLASAPGTTFQTGGTSTFGAGDDLFTNAGALNTLGALTTFNFQGGNNVFVNAGTTTVGLNPVLSGGSRFLLTSLTTFNNSGTLQMTNGVVGDSIVAAGSRYVGSGGARLAIDAQVGAPGSVADTLTVGVSSGRTAVLITDRTTGYGSFNPGGVRIVTGTTHAGDFVLDAGSTGYNPTLFGGAIDKPGLFFSQLAVDGSGNTVLASAPKEQVYQVATLGAQVQALWYGTERSPNRQADLRDGLAGGDDGEGPQSGLWMDIKGLTASRDVTDSFAALGTTYQYDASYSQDMRSVMIGLDSVHLSSRGGLVVGGSLGYVRSDADFDRQSSTSQLEGIVANGYATLLAGDMFVAGTVGVSGMNARVVAPTLTGYTRQVTDINTVGGSLEAGVRKPFILGSTIEPSLSFTYVRSRIDDFAAAGSTFRFDDVESQRVGLGVRMSGAAMPASDGWRSRYNVSVRVYDELAGDNGVVIDSGGPDLAIKDRFNGAFGEIRASLVGQSATGWTAYGDTVVRFNDGYTEVGATLGVRLRY
ncbi:MAG: hypothetical protein Q8L66_06930 [Caulobacter sp.]|nr:hypothetical protein [Caulobacter sp.]